MEWPNNFANDQIIVRKYFQLPICPSALHSLFWIKPILVEEFSDWYFYMHSLWYPYILRHTFVVFVVETSEESNTPDGYYLIYYKHWSLTETGFFSQLICYITLFLFMVALLKCCHILIYDGSDDSNEGLSIKADNGYVSGVL